MNTILHNINGLQIEQRCEDGYINASAMCVAYGKDVLDWLKTDNAWKLVVALAEKLQVQPIQYKSSENGTVISTKILITYPTLVILKQGLLENGGGIWIHYKLAVSLAIWINAGLVPLVLDWVEYWLTTCQDSTKPAVSQQFSSLAKAYIESSQALNRTIHTAIHQQTDSLRLALNALVSSNDLTVSDSKSIPVSENTQIATDNLLSTPKGARPANVDEVPEIDTLSLISSNHYKHNEHSNELSWHYTNGSINSSSSLLESTRRGRGYGTGRIQIRIVTKKNGKQYQQAWYDWQIHEQARTISKSTYIPKHLLKMIYQLEQQKAPVQDILKVLGVQ